MSKACRPVPDPANPAPLGKLTFVRVELHGLVPVLDTDPQAVTATVIEFQRCLQDQLRDLCGHVVQSELDLLVAAFRSASTALLWCFNAQEELVRLGWPSSARPGSPITQALTTSSVSVRTVVHTGEPYHIATPDGKVTYHGPCFSVVHQVCKAGGGGGRLAHCSGAGPGWFRDRPRWF